MEQLPFDRFAARIVDRLKLEVEGPLTPDDGLYTELALDSFQSLELLVVVEALADVEVPPPVMPELYTLGDAYGYYRELLVAEGA